MNKTIAIPTELKKWWKVKDFTGPVKVKPHVDFALGK